MNIFDAAAPEQKAGRPEWQSTSDGNEINDAVLTMTLSHLLEGVTVTKIFQTVYGKMVVTHDVEISHIAYDSRKVRLGDLFVAISGKEFDGHAFIKDAVGNGAKAVVLEDDQAIPDSFFMHTGVTKIVVPDCRLALAQISANFFGHPADSLTLVGVTGTNGKTTTASLIRMLLDEKGRKSGLIGTIEYAVGEKIYPATHTTPESLELNGLLAQMVNAGCTSAVMEVSSHALHQHRVEGFNFQAAVFTNLTQDHLDYHQSMEEYFAAKKILFERLDPSAWAVINIDDEWGIRMKDCTRANVLTYGMHSPAEVRATDLRLSIEGTHFTVEMEGRAMPVSTSLVGKFNVYNILAAIAAGKALQIPLPTIQRLVGEMKSVRGRFERIASHHGWTVIIDYAHTPDALEKVLSAIREVNASSSRGRVITVFGCGGNRDRTKRPLMGTIAARLSDLTVVTSDNPREEDPDAIIDEIMAGIPAGANTRREKDRKKGIAIALGMAGSGDVVLIAGKGHEEYQIVGRQKSHFSDREVVEQYLQNNACA